MGILTTLGEVMTINAIIAYLTPYIGWGTGTQVDAKNITALATASAEARVLATETSNGSDVDMIATITSAGSQTITEVGLFDAITAGNIAIYHSHSGVSLATGDKIEYTINYAQS